MKINVTHLPSEYVLVEYAHWETRSLVWNDIKNVIDNDYAKFVTTYQFILSDWEEV